eukprot:s1252_g32.t1
MPFAVAQQKEGGKWRAYLPPQGALDNECGLEPFLMRDPDEVEKCLKHHVENDVDEATFKNVASQVGVKIDRKMKVKEIVKAMASLLCRFEPTDRDALPDDADQRAMMTRMSSTIRAYWMLNEKERKDIIQFCIAIVSKNSEMEQDIMGDVMKAKNLRLVILLKMFESIRDELDFIIEFVSHTTQMDITDAKTKKLEFKDITLCAYNEAPEHGIHFYLKFHQWGKTVSVFAGKNATGQDLYDYIEAFYYLEKEDYKITWGSGTDPSLLRPYDGLKGNINPEQTLYLTLGLGGGGKTTTKANKEKKVLKMNSAKASFTKIIQTISRETVEEQEMLKRVEVIISKFMTIADNSPKGAFEEGVKQLPLPALKQIEEILNSADYSTDYKVVKMADAFFKMEEVKKTKDAFENVLSTGSLALTYAYRKMCVERSAMPIIKSIVEKETYRKENTPTTSPYPTAPDADRMET